MTATLARLLVFQVERDLPASSGVRPRGRTISFVPRNASLARYQPREQPPAPIGSTLPRDIRVPYQPGERDTRRSRSREHPGEPSSKIEFVPRGSPEGTRVSYFERILHRVRYRNFFIGSVSIKILILLIWRLQRSICVEILVFGNRKEQFLCFDGGVVIFRFLVHRALSSGTRDLWSFCKHRDRGFHFSL